ncbi:MAG: NUDIX hydrolase [Sphingomicrobium sp.]
MIPAASLILVREAGDAPEYLMVERSPAMAFAAGATVFPGGRIDPEDEELALGDPADAAKVAAIRECIEESAVAAGLDPPPSPEQARSIQDSLLDGQKFAQILERQRLALNLSTLTCFARWQPGPEVSRRFDTIFFVAKAPEGEWVPNAASGECVAARWVSAKAILDEEVRGVTKLIFPTRKTLERLALHDNFAAILADARKHPAAPITPVIEAADGVDYIRIPDGLGYPVTRDPLTAKIRG